MHTFDINVLIQLLCLRHVSNSQVFTLRKICTCSFMVFLPYIHICILVDGRCEKFKVTAFIYLCAVTCI